MDPQTRVRRYLTVDEDSARWDGFPFRPGDIVISTRSKHGTTWVQAICSALVFGAAEPPAPLTEISPWLDFLVESRDAVLARLQAQRHRRFVKTHTPLDGVPRVESVHYVVVARHPLDAAVSLWHQGGNLDRARMTALTGAPCPEKPRELEAPHVWLRRWIAAEADPFQDLDSLAGVFHHLRDAWARREDPSVVLVHYADLRADLEGQMRRLAGRLAFDVPTERWPSLVEAAGFDRMRARADLFAPDHNAVLLDRRAFFRRGSSGAAAELLDPVDLAAYHERAADLAPADLLAWLHR